MRGLIITENGEFVETEIINLEDMQKAVKGNFELIIITASGMEIYCNKEGKFLEKINPIATGIIETLLGFGLANKIYGNLLFWRNSGISDEDIQEVNNWFNSYFMNCIKEAKNWEATAPQFSFSIWFILY